MVGDEITKSLVWAAILLYFVFCLVRGKFSIWQIMKCLILLLYINNFAVTYLHLYEVEGKKKLVEIISPGKVPPECDPSKMGFKDYFVYLFKGENPCEKYYEATYQNLIYIVVPIKVIIHQITNLLGLMKGFGGGISDLCGGLFVRLPWGLNFILWPIVLIFFLVVTLIIYSLVFDRTLKINFFIS